MNATLTALIEEVRKHGGTLSPRGGKLHVAAPEPLPDALMDRLREHKSELMRLLSGGTDTPANYFDNLLPKATPEPGRVLHTNYGAGYPDAPPPEPMPRPVVAWTADLTVLLNRVATHFEWSDADRRDFVGWARRSAEGLSDARLFLEHEVAKLPAPGLDARRRVVLAIRGAGTCELGIPREKFDALELPLLIDRLTDPRRPDAGNT